MEISLHLFHSTQQQIRPKIQGKNNQNINVDVYLPKLFQLLGICPHDMIPYFVFASGQ